MRNSSDSLAIVIVSYNCCEALRGCLASANGCLGGSRIIVIDNASNDGSAAMVRREYPAVELIENAENRGFAAACNQGIRARHEEFVLLLNPDTKIDTDGIKKLLDVMKTQPRVGACGPRILNLDGSLQPSCRLFPTLGVIVWDELGRRGGYRMRNWPHDETREVDQLMGSCLLLRRAALEQIGFLDERFFLYFEEVDLCLRLKQAGWRVLFVHEAMIFHAGGQSSRQERDSSVQHRYRSLFAFYRKHYPPWQLPVLKAAVQLGALARTLAGQRQYAAIGKKVWSL